MKRFSHITFVALGVFLFLCTVSVYAANPIKENKEGRRTSWSSKPNSRSGLFSMKNSFVSHGITLNASAMYYYGDVDNMGVAFNGGFNIHNLSYGGAFSFAYMLPASNHVNMRFSLMGGTLHGDNESKFANLPKPRDDYRQFHSIIIQPAVGVEYYPFSQAGFYIYGGIGVTASIIDHFAFWHGKGTNRHLYEGSTFGILPMVQFGLGYSWHLTESWAMAVEVMLQEGVIDAHYMNLDGWPMAASQNSEGVELGRIYGIWEETIEDGTKVKHLHWNDGWFQVGISISYRWNNCEKCRVLNNYYGITSHSKSKNRRR